MSLKFSFPDVIIFIWVLFLAPTIFAQSVRRTPPEQIPLDEIVVTAPGPREDLVVRSGWRPETPDEAHKHIKNAYALLVELEGLAKRCNPDAIISYGDKIRLSPCKKFVELHDSRALVNYNIQCQSLVAWYREFSQEYQESPNWETRDEETLRGFAFFKQNIILTCDVKTVAKNFKFLDTARHDIEKVRTYVASRGNAPAGQGGFAPINSNTPRPENNQNNGDNQ